MTNATAAQNTNAPREGRMTCQMEAAMQTTFYRVTKVEYKNFANKRNGHKWTDIHVHWESRSGEQQLSVVTLFPRDEVDLVVDAADFEIITRSY